MRYQFTAFLISVALGFSSNGIGQITCQTKDLKAFHQGISEHKISKIVFLASWCYSCKDHILQSDAKSTYFVIAFDEPKKAERALQAIKPEAQFCAIDQEEKIRNHYKVSHLPAEIFIDNSANK